MKKVIVIGAGFSGLSTAALLAKAGFEVDVIEKHEMSGGRARKFSDKGFTFDMGPSWYWMPDVFERYFELFGKKTSDYYKLIRLDPSYTIYFGPGDKIDLPANTQALYNLFDSIEPGSGNKLKVFLEEAAFKYEIGIKNLVFKPNKSAFEYLDLKIMRSALKMHVIKSFHSYIRKFFTHPKLLRILEFPILFLGATAEKTPALYSLMNYGDMILGTWYPEGGMFKVVEGFQKVAEEMGARFHFNEEVKKFEYTNNKITAVVTSKGSYEADYVIASADYHHVEQKILPEQYRNYKPAYWDSRTMSPSSLIYYLGIDKKLDGMQHHTLIFNKDFEKHAQQIYETPQWPENPSVYLSCTSQTDATTAPKGKENLFILIPVAPGLNDTDEIREHYFDFSVQRIEETLNISFKDDIIFKRNYSNRDFAKDYYAFKGNAYGLANTLMQTAILKPSMFNKKLPNLLYTGQLTIPGPGVPPAIISGQIAADQIIKKEKN
ncbi:MAG: phytoene desaturase [Bacteroidetes bacterium]|nr:phytoene desaturase [Bacteroidota bacterium]MBU1580051.1 phytoene desaturase [Bacteroidota bacterium]MBU2559033.1 phytoene desaturase [Bacteroidota bacterium]